ncbi:BamA/TamA family outer membrane protein [Pedobacter sp. LMG 31464]|uniref:BamA/TamA family outer membrane protein n=1 Tax=Pedobacter planticolens TaxID=2679964 RepID=A0A923DZ32_9SPHI|nr:BamA/TamA family outer membrane protein [Pedobacter planticolens]MBB2145433.1 BamA/TamA family outer membrane protein [Pedobacter planticolens]
MLKKLLLIVFLFQGVVGFAQDSVKYRVILIGDAGEMNAGQAESLKNAAKHVIKGKTTTLYLGDNIYPVGMAIPGYGDFAETSKILQSQFKPMRDAGAAVYFVPGNHDWDKSGPNGLAKIQAQSEYLESFNDPLLKLIPANGCPDPVAIKLTDKLTIIAYDSEWWLFPYNKANPAADCDCQTKDEVIARMEDLMEQNKNKIILLASHHPFQSYGSHGGYFTWRNHLLPLTLLNKNLVIPLPIIGSVYPLLRSTLLSPEDLNHPLYKDMMKSVNGVFGNRPNVIYVAGHEHGLQLIKSDQLQIISGAGSKMTPNKKGKNSLFQEMRQGYVIADQLLNNDMRYEYYIYADTGVKKVFSYTQPFKEIVVAQKNAYKVIKGDSISIKVHPSYDSVGKFHRFLFGENYRKDYAQETKFPVLRISEIQGGLTPTQLGGGNQSHSLRLKDKNGKEWVLRSVEKNAEVLLPQGLRETFAKDIIKDNMSAQHPFGALIVPTIADAVNIPHSTPIIGWVSPDVNLGDYSGIFANTLCLLEEREPLGDSDNTAKMFKKLDDDNDNTYDGPLLLRARALDVMLGDWDRHEDQWRWKPEKTEKGVKYLAIPRDRDMVFYSTDGFIQRYAQSSSLLPMMQGYERNIKKIDWFLWEGRAMNSRLMSQFTEVEWDKIIQDFCAKLTDDVFEKALKKLPEPNYSLRHDQFLKQLKERRATLPKLMNEYYHFFNRIVDIQTSNKNEKIVITDSTNQYLKVQINKISKEGNIKEEIFSRNFDPEITKEIRLYTKDGNDSLVLNNKTSNIKLRVIAGAGKKVYDVPNSATTVQLFGRKNGNSKFEGDDENRLRKKMSVDTSNVSYLGKDMYSRSSLILNAGFNTDDGLLLGLNYKITNPGFRKQPYENSQHISFLHSFATTAFRFNYYGDWLKLFGKADFTLKADAYAPDNTQNFFGVGNETKYTNEKIYYRARFNIYQLEAALRWRRPKSTFSVGPSFQYYKYDNNDNIGRITTNISQLHSYDSTTVAQDKLYGGVVVNFVNNTRDNEILPTLGSYVDFKWSAFKSLSKYANSYGQFTASIALYKNLDGRAKFVLADRFGGGITVGKPAFYQNLFLGGQGNLLGYRQFRFAGQHSFYNNVELRAKLGDFVSYVLPGQVGLMGFYDVGRVWATNEKSDAWHHGVGGGVYFAPASLTIFRFIMGHSNEGWYPYVSMNFRY